MAGPVFKRILLKLSGESLMGSLDYGTDPARVTAVAGELARVHRQGVELAVVVGAGNIYRGMAGAAAGMDRAPAGYKGVLAPGLQPPPPPGPLGGAGGHTPGPSADPN